MRIYLAGRYGSHPEMRRYRDQLAALGHRVTSRWIEGTHDERADALGLTDPVTRDRFYATEDIEDLMAADCSIHFTEEPQVIGELRLPGPDDEEQWMPVAGSTLGYQVSSFGRVVNGSGEFITGKRSRGYLRVRPSGVVGSTIGIHLLVAGAFLGPCPDGHEVDHLDGRKDNNWAGNLEYVTHAENVRRAAHRMRGGPHAGSRNGRAKLTFDEVADIRRRLRDGATKAALARDFGVSDTLICHIGQGKLWPIEDPSRHRGGRHVEIGVALMLASGCCGWTHRVIVVGHRENVFHSLPEVEFYPTWDECLAVLREEAEGAA